MADIWALSDNRAGNARQAQALAHALDPSGFEAVQLTPQAPWRWLAPRRLPGARLAFGADFAQRLRSPPTLTIGCGRQAALATRLLRTPCMRTIQILNPRLDPRHWDLLVVPEHDRLHGDNILPLLGSLNPVDDAWLADGRGTFSAFGALPSPRTALLVGGPTTQAPWTEQRMKNRFAELAGQIHTESGSLLATTSRRTPPALIEALRTIFSALPHVIWENGEKGHNPYAGLLGWADRVVVSPDSVNLLSEACATRLPVMVVLAEQAKGRLAHFQHALHARNRLQSIWLDWRCQRIEPLRETARVATEIQQRLLDIQSRSLP